MMIDYSAGSADAWEALCIEQFQLCRLDWAPTSFDASLRASANLPELSLRLLTSGPFGVSRSAPDIRRQESEDTMVVLHDAGVGGHIEHKGRRSDLRPGDAVIIDTRRPYAFDFSLPIQQAVLKIPKELAGRLLPDAGRVLHTADSPLSRVLRTILKELIELDSPSPSGQEPAERTIEATSMAVAAIDLISAMYASDASRNPELLGHDALLKTGQDFVRSRLWDPALSPSLVAEHLGVSPRLVAQVFSGAGMTPAAFIRGARIEEAARLLHSRQYREVPIFDIGIRVGFVDATTFTRAFKRFRGMVPSEFRAALTL